MDHGVGPYLFDVDGNCYVDFVMSWGPLLFGHAPPPIVKAVTDAAGKGTSFGASTVAEVELAEKISMAVPSIEKVRLVNSGTEAVMSAVRVARGFTGRNKVIKFEGNYHGHSDGFLSKSGSGLATFGLPDSAGVPPGLTEDMVTVPYNSTEIFKETIRAVGTETACVILEPIAGNMGVVPPAPGFLEAIRRETTRNGALLIFDEVISGFRVSRGGAQQTLGITPDMTTLGKIIGGGLPLAAYGGRADIMETVAPVGPVYQAGTLSGNPLAVAAGLAQLNLIDSAGDALYAGLDAKMLTLALAVKEEADRARVPVTINRVGSMMTVFFTSEKVTDYQTVKSADTARYGLFFRTLLDRGIYLAPSQFEAMFLSTAHGEQEILDTVAAARDGFASVKASG